MKISFLTTLFSPLILLLCVTAGTSHAVDIEAITKPSADVMLSFMRGGRVQEVLIEEGADVEQGQLLATLEDKIDSLQLKQLELRAKDTSRIQSVEIEIAQRNADLAKLEWANQRGAVTKWELDHARLDLKTANISLKQAQLEHRMAQLQSDEIKAQIALLTMHSPISGQIEKVLIEPGEASQPMTPVIRVVRIDPLYIDVHVPIETAQNIAPKQVVSIKTEDQGDERFEATINHISAVADAASMTIRVELELQNPERRPAGQRVIVQF